MIFCPRCGQLALEQQHGVAVGGEPDETWDETWWECRSCRWRGAEDDWEDDEEQRRHAQ